MDWLWLLVFGLGTGTFGVVVGTGGGLILVPMLLLFSDMEPAVVAGTSLTLVALNSFSGSLAYRRQGLVDGRSGLLFGAAAAPGSVVAPFVVASVAGGTFRVLFGLLLVGLAVQMLARSRVHVPALASSKRPGRAFTGSRHITTRGGEEFDYDYNELLAVGLNGILGFISAFFGTGGGFIRTPVLVTSFGFPMRVAVATSIFALSIYATTGALVHAYLGHVDWYPAFVWTGLGLIVGGQAGALLSARVRSLWIFRMLIVLLLAVGIRLLIQGAVG